MLRLLIIYLNRKFNTIIEKGSSVKKVCLSIISLLLWYVPVAFVQMISARVTIASINPWYNSLIKASWTPPAWVFGPAWTILYILMTISVWVVYRTQIASQSHRMAYPLFFLQLVANGLWSFLFFGFHMIGWALVDLTLLIVLIVCTTICFYRIKPVAGLLLIPYLLWCLYALTLNAAIWWLN